MATSNPVFEAYRERLSDAARQGGGSLLDLIRGIPEMRERVALYMSARRVLLADLNLPGRLDMACEVASAGTAEIEGILTEASDGAQKAALLRSLHILNFNLAADLCDCWPGDDAPREKRHHEIGLRAAEYLLSGAFDGMVPARGLANDFWVRGMHQLSLGDAQAARDSWTEAVALAEKEASGEGAAVPDALEQLTLCRGYLAIATWLTSASSEREDAAAAFREASAEFAARRDDDEARFNLGQLEKVRARYAPELPGGLNLEASDDSMAW